MEITRYHNKKEYALDRRNIVLAVVSLAILIWISVNDYIYNHLQVNGYFTLYVIALVALIILPFILPFMIYKDTFKGKCIVNNNQLEFTDSMNLFNKTIKKEDITSIVKSDNKVILHLKNNKNFVFFIDKDIDENYKELVSFISTVEMNHA